MSLFGYPFYPGLVKCMYIWASVSFWKHVQVISLYTFYHKTQMPITDSPGFYQNTTKKHLPIKGRINFLDGQPVWGVSKNKLVSSKYW